MTDIIPLIERLAKAIGDPAVPVELSPLLMAAKATLQGLERELAEARFRPMGDNHHNALKCPHCNPDGTIEAKLSAAESRAARAEAALKKIADTGLDSEGDGFADADSLIMVARKILHPTQETPR